MTPAPWAADEEGGDGGARLCDILSSGDRAAVMGLRRGPGQDRYLDSMEEIFAGADEEQRAMPHPGAVRDTETGALVGFAMISDNIPLPMDDDLVGPYYLWKLLIDHRFQRCGYGAATLEAVVDYLRTRPGAGALYTSLVRLNASTVDSGPWAAGRPTTVRMCCRARAA